MAKIALFYLNSWRSWAAIFLLALTFPIWLPLIILVILYNKVKYACRH